MRELVFFGFGLAFGSVVVTKISNILKGRKLMMLLTNIVAFLSLYYLVFVNTHFFLFY